MELDIIIVNYSSDDLVLSCLESMKEAYQKTPNIIVNVHIVCDGEYSLFSISDTNYPFKVHCLLPQKRLGFGPCCNIGVNNGTAAYVLLLNSDTSLPTNFFKDLGGYLKQVNKPLSVGFKLVSNNDGKMAVHNRKFPTKSTIIKTLLGKKVKAVLSVEEEKVYSGELEGEVDQVIGAVWLIDRASFEMVGGFDERYFVYYEDVDLALRLNLNGVQSRYSKTISVMHAENGTSSRFPSESLTLSMEGKITYSVIHFGVLFSFFLLLGILFIEYPLRFFKTLLIERSWIAVTNTLCSVKLFICRFKRLCKRIL